MTTVQPAPDATSAAAPGPGAAVVLGVGPGLGLSVARRLGRGGHPVAVVSRSAARHDHYRELLEGDGTTAITEVADVRDHGRLVDVLARIERQLGPIDVLYHGPAGMGPGDFPVPIELTTVDSVRDSFKIVESAVDAVSAVLPGMLERGRGTILLPGGVSAIRTMPQLGNLSLAAGALHRYALTLNAALADRGVFAASILIGGGVRGGDIYAAMAKNAERLAEAGLDAGQLATLSLDPDEIADRIWDLTVDRDRPELVFSVLD